MLTQSDINSLDLAHTHAKSVKKKTALEMLFISLYAKYNAGETLSKVEEKTIKDYLAVYRSEFALLKKKAKLKNKIEQTETEKLTLERSKFKKHAISFYDTAMDFTKAKNDLNYKNTLGILTKYRLFLLGMGFY